jgi:hypothetical protein
MNFFKYFSFLRDFWVDYDDAAVNLPRTFLRFLNKRLIKNCAFEIDAKQCELLFSISECFERNLSSFVRSQRLQGDIIDLHSTFISHSNLLNENSLIFNTAWELFFSDLDNNAYFAFIRHSRT